MKLRNKKTGEIKPAEAREDGIYLYDETTEQWYKYELDLLAKGWEYYEPKESFWTIGKEGAPIKYDFDFDGKFYEECDNKWVDKIKEMGFYFETKEEAEKAVEKLKAWKRLRDKGFRFLVWNDDYTIDFTINGQNAAPFKLDESSRDLHIVFGGGE